MQIIDTFSGIGGFSLAGSWIGWRTIQFCEIDKFCQKVLKYHWPDVPLHEDIKTLTSEIIKSSPLYEESESTIFVGGVPCQPWSLAGKRKGKADDRNLWPQTVKLIGAIHPDWAVLENVFGLTNWNGGVVFREVLSDLEYEGYEVQPFIIPACAVNAPHRRDRVWIVGNAKDKGRRERNRQKNGNDKWKMGECGQEGNEIRADGGTVSQRYDWSTDWLEVATELCRMDDGISTGLDLSGYTYAQHRVQRLKALGNSIVPQVAIEIMKSIKQYG